MVVHADLGHDVEVVLDQRAVQRNVEDALVRGVLEQLGEVEFQHILRAVDQRRAVAGFRQGVGHDLVEALGLVDRPVEGRVVAGRVAARPAIGVELGARGGLFVGLERDPQDRVRGNGAAIACIDGEDEIALVERRIHDVVLGY